MTSPAAGSPATCSLHNLQLATCHLAVATCHLPFATRHLQFDFNFKLKLFPGKRRERNEREREKNSHQSIGNQCELHTTLESTCCSTYKQPRPFALFFSTTPLSLPLFQPAAGQARPGPFWPGQLNVHFHVHRRHCEVTINCKHFHFCQ